MKFIEALTALLKVKSLITIGMTAALVAMLFGGFNPPKELLALFCTTYGAMMAYYFQHKSET